MDMAFIDISTETDLFFLGFLVHLMLECWKILDKASWVIYIDLVEQTDYRTKYNLI